MTKLALCVGCADMVAPYRSWTTDRRWRWCECGRTGTRWRDGTLGLLEVTSRSGPDGVRIVGLNNWFLQTATQLPAGTMAGHWRDLHDNSVDECGRNYLFHRDNRACWALVVAVGDTGDVVFADPTEFVRWYLAHDHEGFGTHEHSTANRHPGNWPNRDHVGILTETWQQRQDRHEREEHP